MDFKLENANDITTEERLDDLAEVLAEGFLYLAEHGLLEDKQKISTQTDASAKVNQIRNE